MLLVRVFSTDFTKQGHVDALKFGLMHWSTATAISCSLPCRSAMTATSIRFTSQIIMKLFNFKLMRDIFRFLDVRDQL